MPSSAGSNDSRSSGSGARQPSQRSKVGSNRRQRLTVSADTTNHQSSVGAFADVFGCQGLDLAFEGVGVGQMLVMNLLADNIDDQRDETEEEQDPGGQGQFEQATNHYLTPGAPGAASGCAPGEFLQPQPNIFWRFLQAPFYFSFLSTDQ